MAVEKIFNGNTYNSDTSFAEYKYITALLTMAGDIMVEADARSGALSTWTFSTATADADPGDGAMQLNQTTQNTATVIYADLLDAYGATVTDILDALAGGTSAVKGLLLLRQRNDRTRWMLFRLTGVTTASGYRKLAVTVIGASAASPFANGAVVLMSFSRTGDKGDTGSLSGGPLTGDLDADGTHKLINLPAPTNAGDVTPKSYVDAAGAALGNQARVWAAVWGA